MTLKRLAPTALAFLIAVSAAGAANAGTIYDVSVAGAGLQQLAPSADTLTLNSATDKNVAGTFNFQTGLFKVGDSGTMQQTNSYVITEDVTINGQMLPVAIDVGNAVSNPLHGNLDYLTLSVPSVTDFQSAGVALTVLSYATSGYAVGGQEFIQLYATLTPLSQSLSATQNSTPVPEPASVPLMGVGLVALGLLRRRKAR